MIRVNRQARRIKLAQVLAQVLLVFEDEEGRVVHTELLQLEPIYQPHGANLEAALEALLAPMQEQLSRNGEG